MTHLVACLGDYSENLDKIICSQVFDRIYLVCDLSTDTKAHIVYPRNVIITHVVVEFTKPIDVLTNDIVHELKKYFGKDKMLDLDIALNISSGTGKEHAAVISALMKLGYGIRLIELDAEGDVAAL